MVAICQQRVPEPSKVQGAVMIVAGLQVPPVLPGVAVAGGLVAVGSVPAVVAVRVAVGSVPPVVAVRVRVAVGLVPPQAPMVSQG